MKISVLGRQRVRLLFPLISVLVEEIGDWDMTDEMKRDGVTKSGFINSRNTKRALCEI